MIEAFLSLALWGAFDLPDQTSSPSGQLIMVDEHRCALSRGPYCIIIGEGENSVERRGRYNLVRIHYDESLGDVTIREPVSCSNSISRNPYVSSISRRRSRILITFYLNDRCNVTVSAPDHHADPSARGIVIALTQIQTCRTTSCEWRPLATLISRRGLGWPD